MNRPTPYTAIADWWGSLQANDVSALTEFTLEDFISSGGPGDRTVGRDEMLKGVNDFMANASIEDWSVTDVEVREHGDVAVCSYRWAERGAHAGTAFDMRGLATDVLVFVDGRWRHQAHHVSMLG